jgi:hypothetical protein
MSKVLLGPGATGIVGAVGGATHDGNDMMTADAAAICRWKRFICSRPMAS